MRRAVAGLLLLAFVLASCAPMAEPGEPVAPTPMSEEPANTPDEPSQPRTAPTDPVEATPAPVDTPAATATSEAQLPDDPWRTAELCDGLGCHSRDLAVHTGTLVRLTHGSRHGHHGASPAQQLEGSDPKS
jgi:hypothetical protein